MYKLHYCEPQNYQMKTKHAIPLADNDEDTIKVCNVVFSYYFQVVRFQGQDETILQRKVFSYYAFFLSW